MNAKAQQIPLDFVSRPAMGREDFLIGPENKDAAAWVDRWPDWPAPLLVLCGAAASGKSHLAAVWQERTGAALIKPDILTLEGAEQIAARAGNIIIDGLDPWLGDRAAETTLFHLYNIFKENERSFLVTMRMSPTAAEFEVADLASRFRGSPVALIHPPEDALLASILIKLFNDRQLAVAEDVIRYILPRMERSFIAARDIVEHADSAALAQKRGISIPLMRQVLAELQGK